MLQQRVGNGFDAVPVFGQQRAHLRAQAFDVGVENIISRLQLLDLADVASRISIASCLICRTSPLASASPAA
jgi:hypothetical protein